MELVAAAATGIGEADRERREPSLASHGEQRDDQTRVKAAGEQHADGDVGDHAPLHGGSQRRRGSCGSQSAFDARTVALGVDRPVAARAA